MSSSPHDEQERGHLIDSSSSVPHALSLEDEGRILALFNTGDLETCGNKGYISLSVSGKRDEATLKQQTVTIFQAVVKKL